MFKNALVTQIEEALNTKDYSLFTRRCLDFSNDFALPETLVVSIFDLRKKYLNTDGLNALGRTDIHSQANELLEILKTENYPLKNNQAQISNCVFTANNISKQFQTGQQPFKLHPLSFELNIGEITGVVGENGNGKTTLLKIIAGQLSSDTGDINFPALGTDAKNWYEAKNKFAFIPQRIQKWHGTLLENLLFFASIHNIKGRQSIEQVNYMLFRLGLDKYRDLTWDQISSGYRMRFELAKMLLWRPRLLILDEPLANLDINAQQLFLQDLRFFSQSKSHPLAIILSSQQLHEIERIADNIIFIRQGVTKYNGKQADYGINREINLFEVAGDFTLQQLQKCLTEADGFKIEDAGTAFIINCNLNTKWFDILDIIKKAGLKLNYYRDISQSTRQLFHKDI